MIAAGQSFSWYARHEVRLAWRDLVAFLSGGRRNRLRASMLWIALIIAVLHLVANGAVTGASALALPPARETLIVLTGAAFLSWTLMLAQAMESVTRVLYGRDDLDLILSSPASVKNLFALRTGLTALSTMAMALFLVGPFINMAAVHHGAAWLSAYALVAAMGAFAAAAAIGVTLLLFRWFGPRRTRTIAQVLAAVIGAGFVIFAQVIGIIVYGDISRLAILTSPMVLDLAPDADSLLWIPARAATGEAAALVTVVSLAAAAFVAMTVFAGDHVPTFAVEAASTHRPAPRSRGAAVVFDGAGPVAQLRRKEVRLILRDPWLISQTLMQILYLLPPALMLWINFGSQIQASIVLVPVVVMAAGQLAGGIAWLTISGEDAPDLVASAPLTPSAAIRAKIEAVLVCVLVPVAPLVLAVGLSDPPAGMTAAIAVFLAVASATAIQFLFRQKARRAHFRRRQTASRFATFAEAFSSISWAATSGLAAAQSPVAVVPAGIAILVLVAAVLIAPRRA